MRQVVRFICGECAAELPTPDMAEACEKRDRENRKLRAKAKAEEKYWNDNGHDVWHEHGGMKHAPRVDAAKFGSHEYGDEDGTSDCAHGCKCWMGPCASGGPVNSFGPCPNNPKASAQ